MRKDNGLETYHCLFLDEYIFLDHLLNQERKNCNQNCLSIPIIIIR